MKPTNPEFVLLIIATYSPAVGKSFKKNPSVCVSMFFSDSSHLPVHKNSTRHKNVYMNMMCQLWYVRAVPPFCRPRD